MRLLDRKGWTLAQWSELSLDERNLWLDYEAQREEMIAGALEAATRPNDDGKVLAEIVTAQAAIAQVRFT